MKPAAALLGSLLVLSGLVVACKGSAAHGSAAEAQQFIPPLGKGTPAQNLTNAYLSAQTQLGLDDFVAARAAFGSVRSAARATELPLTAELRTRIEAAASAGVAAPDIVRLRAAFAALSDALLEWFKTQTNPLAETLAVAHCPMALDGQGARWLQRGTPLKNPYFGAQMSTCGSVVASLAPAKKL
jgi:Cu(I)/Ag(I) efflux system membrane fusion protein